MDIAKQIVENVFVLSILDTFRILFSLVVSIVFGLLISQIYKRTHRGMNYELSFMSTLVLLAPIVTLVMLFIRGDLVLSLGLIGSLSIIRFRTPVKDTRDMIFLFWTIAVGLGAGTYNWMTVILANAVIIPLVLFLHLLRYGRSDQADFILVCTGEAECPLEALRSVIGRAVTDAAIRSHEVDGQAWETVFELRGIPASGNLPETLVRDCRAIDGVKGISLLAPKLDLPV